MSERVANVIEAIREDLEYSAIESERFETLRSVLSDEQIVERCLDTVGELFKEHKISRLAHIT